MPLSLTGSLGSGSAGKLLYATTRSTEVIVFSTSALCDNKSQNKRIKNIIKSLNNLPHSPLEQTRQLGDVAKNLIRKIYITTLFLYKKKKTRTAG
jgi:hypothetical protein